jgi:FdhD protein
MSQPAEQPKKRIGIETVSIVRYRYADERADESAQVLNIDDSVAIESPLEIRIVFGPSSARKDRSLSITMRTPGHDSELAAGFLLSEGIIRSGAEIDSFEFCGTVPEGEPTSNQLRVNLNPSVEIDMSKLQRHFYTTSSCGVCGKASLDAIEAQNVSPLINKDLSVPASLVRILPDLLRQQQDIFGSTGGLHAAGLFSANGELLALREDVGRHNAVDKLVGQQLIDVAAEGQGGSAMSNLILVVSGRASFELAQKAIVAQIPMMVAVGAPSSLAVDLAKQFGFTLVGFNTGKKFNVYSGGERVG